jgi:hypothetical protein
MTRGYRPVVAIEEAQHKAVTWGYFVITVITTIKFPFDFMIHDRGCTSMVRIRRLKYAGYSTEEIGRSCAQEIRELRELHDRSGIYRELWVRGPDRTWHRYLILPGSIECLENRI